MLKVKLAYVLYVSPGPRDTDEDMTHETSTLSMYSDEGLDLSQRISESLFMGPDVEADSEIVTGMLYHKR